MFEMIQEQTICCNKTVCVSNHKTEQMNGWIVGGCCTVLRDTSESKTFFLNVKVNQTFYLCKS